MPRIDCVREFIDVNDADNLVRIELSDQTDPFQAAYAVALTPNGARQMAGALIDAAHRAAAYYDDFEDELDTDPGEDD
jgi:hypothetical protein